eukprot:TRINITY_DN2507_c0_g1_i1.p1 TRINITY_DN2507_c0_g1~~TRINITY_DN2507_c0_g1_i1.p1  ORF type:complete len:252 (-),score=86.55 TRINITY_DN2507_c0_g1_i1:88-843(-)
MSESTKIDNELTKNAVEIRQIIQDFPLCSTFREIDDQNALVRGEMEVMRSNISKLELIAMEMLDLEQSQLTMSQVESHREQLASCQRQFRLANVKAMTALETQSSRDLFKNANDGGKGGLRNRKDKEQMVAEHGSITNNLMAISRQLAETVEKSKQTVSNLEGTSRTVEEVGEEHRMMGGVIGQSRKLITKYGRREFTDKVLIIFALAFFFAVVLYILRKRLFPTYGPIEVVLYMLGFTGNVFSSITSLWS